MGALRNAFRNLIQGLYVVGTIVVGGPVGAIGKGILVAYHGIRAAYMAYRRKTTEFYKNALNVVTLGFVPFGDWLYAGGHIGSAASSAYAAYKGK
jgi:hypothetical protein